MSEQLISMIIDLKSPHQNRVDKCQMIIDEKDADIRPGYGRKRRYGV